MFFATIDATCGLRNMRPLCFHVDGIKRLTAGHEETIAFCAAEADITANLRQENLANARPVRCEDLHSIVAFADPARADPDISVHVGADAVSEPGFAV